MQGGGIYGYIFQPLAFLYSHRSAHTLICAPLDSPRPPTPGQCQLLWVLPSIIVLVKWFAHEGTLDLSPLKLISCEITHKSITYCRMSMPKVSWPASALPALVPARDGVAQHDSSVCGLEPTEPWAFCTDTFSERQRCFLKVPLLFI